MTPSRTRLKADFTLLLVSIFWGSAFVAQRVAASYMSPFFFNGIRFILGALILIPFSIGTFKSFFMKKLVHQNALKGSLSSQGIPFYGLFLAGLLLFIGNTFQQIGLKYTTAGNAGFITGLYVVFTPLLEWLIWKRKPGRLIIFAVISSFIGLFLLTSQGTLANPGELVKALNQSSPIHQAVYVGDALELAGALMWSFHMILIGWLVKKVDIFPLAIIQYLVCGILCMVVSTTLEGFSTSGLTQSWWTVVYTAVFSIALGYTLQAVGQIYAPATDAAIILSMEAVFAAICGWLFINEKLSAIQILGCVLMLFGMLIAQRRKQVI